MVRNWKENKEKQEEDWEKKYKERKNQQKSEKWSNGVGDPRQEARDKDEMKEKVTKMQEEKKHRARKMPK